jgi:hypothetical protein
LITARIESSVLAPLITAADARYAAKVCSTHVSTRSHGQRALAAPYSPLIMIGEMRRLLARIWSTFDLGSVLPANAFCSLPTRRWLRGAETKKPYRPILNALESILAAASACSYAGASLDTFLEGTPARWLARISVKQESMPAKGCQSALDGE